jgi:hypothetical protein
VLLGVVRAAGNLPSEEKIHTCLRCRGPKTRENPKLLADFRVALGMWKHAAEQENREAQKSLLAGLTPPG